MSQRPAPSLLLLFLLMIPGVCSQWSNWGVWYSPSHICALQGSSVIMSCTYTYPTGHRIRKVFWTKTNIKEKNKEFPDLSKDPEYSQRLQYLGDKQQICTIRLSHVTLKDSRMYYFRFITYNPDGKWFGDPGVTLTVTDLQVESPERVTEGDSVRLTCKSSCTLTDRATFIWYRNSQPLIKGNQIILWRVSREDTGTYSCGVDGHSYISLAVQLNIRYPPVNPVISISPSGEIVSGHSVTLICSSDSNPPAEISWFKGRTFVGSGRIFNISNISSDDSGEYKCKSTYEHEDKYSAVTLNVMYPPRNVSVLITGSGEIVSGDSVTLICSSDSNPPALNFSWFKENESSVVGSGQSFSALQSGRFYCQAHNQHGSHRSDAVTVTVHHGLGWHVWLGITVACLGFFIIIIIILFIMRKRRDAKTEDHTVKQDNLYSDVTGRDVHVSESADCDDAQYATVTSSKPRRDRNAPDRRDTEEIQYATVQHHKNKQTKRSEENESQYGNIRIHQPESAVSQWHVSYSPSHICALKDSSVIMSCTYTYPTGYQIRRVFWTKGNVKEDGEYLDLSEDPEYSQRLQYLGDKQQICNIRLSHVTLKDSRMYYFRFITNITEGKWIGKPGVTLTVTDLQVESPERVTEGDSVRLTCKSSCTLTDRATFIWYRNSQPLTERRDRNNELLLQSVRREDAGRYSCAVHGHNHISPAVQLNVMYPPKSVSVSTSPSGEIVSGDSVTLICSSDSNPPALNFSWFKENESSAVGSGQSFSALQSGRFYCQAHNQHGSQRSDAVTVTGEAFINTLLYLHIIHQFGELIMMIFLFQFIMVLVGM
ncbi:B-cell receptor CD22 [Anabarilius grahami]|uniref:B-cell receptor CD22 n=1 Tax=Anabarilius grahami TaxID=495550 RepID=A0A3N0Z0E4_ANAGA|nr:B-cell receptor CD22 [Anabarilius grahami]